MNHKKSPNKPGCDDTASSQVNELYLAHQVHTLAQMVFMQMMPGWRPGANAQGMGPGPMFAGSPSQASNWPGTGVHASMPGFMPHGSPQFVYWYP